MHKYLISSASGYGNVGDDICGYSAKYIIEQIDSNAKVAVTSPPFKEYLARNRRGIALGGGGIIYDRSEPNVDNFLKYLEYAQENDMVSAALGVGVQGIVTDRGKRRYMEILNKTDLVTTRSNTDKKQLEAVGVKNVITTQDLGFLADEWVKDPIIKPRLKTTTKPRLGLGLVDVRFLLAYKKGNMKLRNYIKIMEDNIERLSREFEVYLFAHSKDDEEWRNELSSKYGLVHVKYRKIRDFPKFFYMYKQMDIVLGVRFHSVILGLLARKPVVAIGSSGAKQFKLAKSSPTLNKQCYAMGDSDRLKQLFENLKSMYDEGKFVALPESELGKLKDAASNNIKLMKKVLAQAK